MIDWKQKLASRKFWCALGAYITSMLTAFKVSDNVIVQVTTIIGGIGALIVYILAESYIDGKREENAIIELEQVVEVDDDGDGK